MTDRDGLGLGEARLRLQAAQYEADRAFDQYNLADPKNRLVVDNLETRLNERLAEVQAARQLLDQSLEKDSPVTEEQKQQLQNLACCFPHVWTHPDTPNSLRKQLVRTAIREIVVAHKPKSQQLELIKELSQSLDDGEIARILNMKKFTTPRGLRWTMDRVRNFRAHHGIRKAKQIPPEDVLTGQQAREYLGIGYHGLVALIRRGVLHTNQVTDFAPWRIPRAELDSEEVQDLVSALKKNGRLPAQQGSPDSQVSLFPKKSTTLQKDVV